jgi:hypothetical protein
MEAKAIRSIIAGTIIVVIPRGNQSLIPSLTRKTMILFSKARIMFRN